MTSKWPAKPQILADLKDRIQHYQDAIAVKVDEEAVGNSILLVHRPRNKLSMQEVWHNNSLPKINVTGVTAMAIGHINVQHLQGEADEVEDTDDVVKGEETEAEEEDRMGE